MVGSSAKRQFERRILLSQVKAIIVTLLHESDREHEAVAADFGDQTGGWVDAQAQKLKCATLWQVLLQLPIDRNHLLGRTGVPEHFEQENNGVGQWCETE
jgi:hypothetical protein